MSSLSLCMIVKNEEEALPRCLESVKGVVDEMVVLDTGSTDRTKEIAQTFGARLYEFDWVNDFSVARNQALQYVQSDWILVLDADETLIPDVIPALKQLIQHDRYLLVNLLRQEVGAEQSPYSLISRLFRHHPDIHFSRPYHALVDDSVVEILKREPDWQVISLQQVAILHEGYHPGTIAGRDKAARARAAMEGFLASHPTDPYVCSKLGALYVEMGELTQGIQLLKRGLASVQLQTPVLFELHYHLGIAYSRSQPLKQAILNRAVFHYQTAIEQPVLPTLKLGAYTNLANLLKEQGNLSGAEGFYRITLQIDPFFALGYYNLGLVLKAQGRLREAIVAYEQAIRLHPDYPEAHQNLGVVLLKVGNVAGSLAAFQTAIGLYERQQSPEADRLRQGLEDMGFKLIS